MPDHLPEELPPGFRFGDYVIRACIGRGGMARVYRADRAALNRAVALKVLDQWLLDQPGGSERFLREARTAASIKHPNVVDVVDVGVWQERPFLVMELLTGCDLQTYLARRGPLSEGEVAGLALPIIAGMLAVHEAGVVHRDLKPSNIFLATGAEGELLPKVLDFGVSKFSDKLMEPTRGPTRTREIIGTPAYMAPEALNGVRELGPAADQYALGAIVYECAVGHPPFGGSTLLELLKAIALGNVVAPRALRPELSVDFEAAVLRTLNGTPGARFSTLRDLGRVLWCVADERNRAIWERSFGGRPPVQNAFEMGTALHLPARPTRVRRFERLAARAGWLWGLALCASIAFATYVVRTHGFLGWEPARALPPAQPVASTVSLGNLLVAAPGHGRAEPDDALGATRPSAPNTPHLGLVQDGSPELRANGAAGTSSVHVLPIRRAAGRGHASGRRTAARLPTTPDAPEERTARARGPVDPELQELFAQQPQTERGPTTEPAPAPRVNRKEPQLDDPFPPDAPAETVGANGSPVPD